MALCFVSWILTVGKLVKGCAFMMRRGNVKQALIDPAVMAEVEKEASSLRLDAVADINQARADREEAEAELGDWISRHPGLDDLHKERHTVLVVRSAELRRLQAAVCAVDRYHASGNDQRAEVAKLLVTRHISTLENLCAVVDETDRRIQRFITMHPEYSVLVSAVQTAECRLAEAKGFAQMLDIAYSDTHSNP